MAVRKMAMLVLMLALCVAVIAACTNDAHHVAAPEDNIGLADHLSETCSNIEPSECKTKQNCVLISAQPMDLERDCLHDVRPIICTSASIEPCEEVLTVGKAPDGSHWLFPSSCLPPTWRSVRDPSFDLSKFFGKRCSD